MRHILYIMALTFTYPLAVHAQDQKPEMVRIPPILPQDAEVSGFCCMKLDVSKKGKPKNVEAYSCTHEVYKNSAEKTVKKWKYNPIYIDGKRQRREGIKTKVVYHLADVDGSLIYDTTVYIPRGVDPEHPKGWSSISCN